MTLQNNTTKETRLFTVVVANYEDNLRSYLGGVPDMYSKTFVLYGDPNEMLCGTKHDMVLIKRDMERLMEFGRRETLHVLPVDGAVPNSIKHTSWKVLDRPYTSVFAGMLDCSAAAHPQASTRFSLGNWNKRHDVNVKPMAGYHWVQNDKGDVCIAQYVDHGFKDGYFQNLAGTDEGKLCWGGVRFEVLYWQPIIKPCAVESHTK